jgi:hypothetical protein
MIISVISIEKKRIWGSHVKKFQESIHVVKREKVYCGCYYFIQMKVSAITFFKWKKYKENYHNPK